jgi:hypothetical protein
MKSSTKAREARLRQEFLEEACHAMEEILPKIDEIKKGSVDVHQFDALGRVVEDLARSEAGIFRRLDRLERLVTPASSEASPKRTLFDHVRGGSRHV